MKKKLGWTNLPTVCRTMKEYVVFFPSSHRETSLHDCLPMPQGDLVPWENLFGCLKPVASALQTTGLIRWVWTFQIGSDVSYPVLCKNYWVISSLLHRHKWDSNLLKLHAKSTVLSQVHVIALAGRRVPREPVLCKNIWINYLRKRWAISD